MVKQPPEAGALRWDQVRGSEYRKARQSRGDAEGRGRREGWALLGLGGRKNLNFIQTVFIINKS